MAKHSSFKNLVALEACQNFFLIAEISGGALPNESELVKPSGSDPSSWQEGSVQITDLPKLKNERSFPDSPLED